MQHLQHKYTKSTYKKYVGAHVCLRRSILWLLEALIGMKHNVYVFVEESEIGMFCIGLGWNGM